jgi:starvation-inducible outer membrane lipoprotein
VGTFCDIGAEGGMIMGKMREHCVAVLFMGSMVVLMFLLAACSSTPKTTDGSEAREKDERKQMVCH